MNEASMGDFIPIKTDVLITAGRYPAVLTKYDKWFDKAKPSEVFIRLFFVITEGQFRGEEVKKKYHWVISPKSALGGFCRDMGILIVNENGGFNPVALVTPANRPVILTIRNKEYGGQMRNIVTDIAPWVNAAPGTPLPGSQPPAWTPPQMGSAPVQQTPSSTPVYPPMPQPTWTPPQQPVAPGPTWTPPQPDQTPPAPSNPRLNF